MWCMGWFLWCMSCIGWILWCMGCVVICMSWAEFCGLKSSVGITCWCWLTLYCSLGRVFAGARGFLCVVGLCFPAKKRVIRIEWHSSLISLGSFFHSGKWIHWRKRKKGFKWENVFSFIFSLFLFISFFWIFSVFFDFQSIWKEKGEQKNVLEEERRKEKWKGEKESHFIFWIFSFLFFFFDF